MKFSLILALTLFSTLALPFPSARKINIHSRRTEFLHTIENPAQFEGIVKLQKCSGALVIFKGMPKTKKAIVMTNGHCVRPVLKMGEVTAHKPLTKSFSVFDAQMNLHPLLSSKIIYSTVTDTDVTFFETRMTYQEIEDDFQVEAFVLDDGVATIDQEFDVVSGYWELVTSCKVEAIVPYLKEKNYIWKQSLRYSDDCSTKVGFSGSPVIAKNTRTVIGIHNTGNNGSLDCSGKNPCEIDVNGIVIMTQINRRYAQQLSQVYTCLTQDFEIDVNLPTCQLPKPL